MATASCRDALDQPAGAFWHKLALNTLVYPAVPINPDYRASEIAYLLENAEVDLAPRLRDRCAQLAAGMSANARTPRRLWSSTSCPACLHRSARRATMRSAPRAKQACSTLPVPPVAQKAACCRKGYELAFGRLVRDARRARIVPAEGERIYNPLPVYHCNSSVVSFYGALLKRKLPDPAGPVSSNRWWPEVRQTGATVVHYLGVIVPLLLGRPPGQRSADIRCALARCRSRAAAA